MSEERTAWGWGLASVDAAGTTLDVWYPELNLGEAPAESDRPNHNFGTLAHDEADARGIRRVPVFVVSQLDEPISNAADAYLKLHLMSMRMAKPNTLNLDGILYRFIDTAGLRTTDDAIERMGIERAYASVARTQIVLQVFDAADPAVETLDLRPDQCRILIANKIDRMDPAAAPVSLPDGALPLSAREGRGMEQLLERLRAAVDASALDDGRTIVSNSRHYEALHHARTALDAALGGLETLPSDLLGEEIRQAIFHLGTITGEITTDEVLGQIFSKFCIGK